MPPKKRAYDTPPRVILFAAGIAAWSCALQQPGTRLADQEDRTFDFSEREVVLRADFNELDEESCVWTSMRFMLKGPRHPREGEWVFLLDSHGRGCMGRIEELNGWTAKVRPDWSSWVPDGDRPPGIPPGMPSDTPPGSPP